MRPCWLGMTLALSLAAPGWAGAPEAGDAARGRAVLLDRSASMCLLCHSGPFPEERFQGNLGPSLAGVGKRLDAQALRQRLVDSRSLNPESIMPAYGRSSGFNRPASPNKALLSETQINDLVAFLSTLTEP